MRDDKDRSGKWLIEHHGDGILHLSGVHGFRSWRAALAEVVQPKQLPDGLLEVTFPQVLRPDLFLIEIETYPIREHAEQVFADLALVFAARRVLPEVITLVLRPRGTFRLSGQQQVSSRLGYSHLSFQWRVVELWTLDAEQLLAANDVGLIPWLPLTHYKGTPEALIQQCRERIDQQARPEEYANLLAVTQVTARLAYNNVDVLKLLGGSRPMIESPLIQELVAQSKHEDIMHFLEARFGQVPPEVAAQLQKVLNQDKLLELIRFAAACPDLESFRSKLST